MIDSRCQGCACLGADCQGMLAEEAEQLEMDCFKSSETYERLPADELPDSSFWGE